MTKILIQIPCYNEEKSILATIDDIIKKVSQFEYDILVIDDGSTDQTSKLIKEKVDFIIHKEKNEGLGSAFQSGLDFAKRNGYDYLINTDADLQYKSEYINNLYLFIKKNPNFDIVIGARNHFKIKSFSFIKKILQKLGSIFISFIIRQKTTDAVSGFRIYNKYAINNLNITSNFSYTIDSLVQATDKNLSIGEIAIETNHVSRKSKLVKSNLNFIMKQLNICFNAFLICRPFLFFHLISIPFYSIGIFYIIRFFFFYFNGDGDGHIQSLILASLLILISIILISMGFLGLLIKNLRKNIEKYLKI